MGGHILLDASANEPANFLNDLFIGRTNAAAADALIAIFVLVGFAIVALRRNVIQLPTVSVLTPLFTFWVVLALSITVSKYQFSAMHEFALWTACVVALLGTVCCFGRGKGVRTALCSALL